MCLSVTYTYCEANVCVLKRKEVTVLHVDLSYSNSCLFKSKLQATNYQYYIVQFVGFVLIIAIAHAHTDMEIILNMHRTTFELQYFQGDID